MTGNCRKDYPPPATENGHPSGGRLIAFTGGLGDNDDIWVVRADGSGARRLTSNPGRDWAPAWSSDARKIAFNRVCWEGPDEIVDTHVHTYVMNANGSGQRRLIPGSEESVDPDWSPDGAAIALEASHGIAIVRPDGIGRRQLTAVDGDRSPAWSPDGRQIAFIRFAPNAASIDDGEIYGNADGTGRRVLVEDGRTRRGNRCRGSRQRPR